MFSLRSGRSGKKRGKKGKSVKCRELLNYYRKNEKRAESQRRTSLSNCGRIGREEKGKGEGKRTNTWKREKKEFGYTPFILRIDSVLVIEERGKKVRKGVRFSMNTEERTKGNLPHYFREG